MKTQIQIKGRVQGVGFRPFVYQEALKCNISGYVCNNADGVLIEASGDLIEQLIEDIRIKAPAVARIESIEISEVEGEAVEGFEIRESVVDKSESILTPDIAICNSCMEELFDPENRRYLHPFINCAQCGPRYTMIQMLPYDRNRIAMKHFPMCKKCQAEYDDPTSRRYHTEGICCSECGPKLGFLDYRGERRDEDPIRFAAKLLGQGETIALKGIGGYHLLCDATSDKAVQNLRRIKRRQRKPLAVMFKSLEAMEEAVEVDEYEQEWVLGSVKPILIADQKPAHSISPYVAVDLARLGVFLPYTPLHALIMESVPFPLVVTSANRSGEPIITELNTLFESLEMVRGVLEHDRHIVNACDDSVVHCIDRSTVILRLGRGLAPYSFTATELKGNEIVGMGAHQKSSICIATTGGRVVLGPHIGDLETVESQEVYEKNLQTLQRVYSISEPFAIHDLHPGYASTRLARERFVHHAPIQHHYAHILAVMAEYGLHTKVLGFAFDGSGLGENGQLCGGEVMIADTDGYQRSGHWRNVRLIGGEKAIKEPRRIALSMLFECYGLDEVLEMRFLGCVDQFLDHEIRLMHHMWEKGLSCIDSGSVGRVYDGIASLGNFLHILDYEGESGMVMEGFVEMLCDPLEITICEDEVDWRPMVRSVISLYHEIADPKERKKRIASGLNAAVVKTIQTYVERYPALPAVISGGVFQNRELLRLIRKTLNDKSLYVPCQTPINDGGIALGQVWWALHQSHL